MENCIRLHTTAYCSADELECSADTLLSMVYLTLPTYTQGNIEFQYREVLKENASSCTLKSRWHAMMRYTYYL